ncbi:Short-chain dehydrogenase/reductase SDR [Penicillium camemberti]|uniref:Short-chain dehydrogenase/reductase SDR n=1 Tax=Penicillium camemberti (strain FM 013) TaxID=1429867 RepID=A0A0G4PP57_PENC3|nr:Short-chain dehydrogenase/reductase SDR [Penicillium camemberti]
MSSLRVLPIRLRVPILFIQTSSPGPINIRNVGYVNSQVSSYSLRYTKRSYSSQPNENNHISFQPGNRLAGRKCMITGGTSGIGFAIAERFLQEGASTIVLVGRSQTRLEEAAAKLKSLAVTLSELGESNDEVATRAPEEDNQQSTQGNIRLLVGDVSNAGSWMRELEKEMANVDILVNAAGISISNILPRSELEDISTILRTNLEGAILTSRALMRASIRSRIRNRSDPAAGTKPPSKCIINVSSLLALKGGTGAVPYAASKAGLLGLTRSLAVEASASMKDIVIRSNAIVPGYIETPMVADFTPGETSRLKDLIPLHRFGDPREIADAAVFLAQNEYANNCVLNLDGGLSAV